MLDLFTIRYNLLHLFFYFLKILINKKITVPEGTVKERKVYNLFFIFLTYLK